MAVTGGRGVALGLMAVLAWLDAAVAVIYGLAVVATIAGVLFRPVHSALVPTLCRTPTELTGANVVRGMLDSLSTLVGPALAAVLLAVSGPQASSRPARWRPCGRLADPRCGRPGVATETRRPGGRRGSPRPRRSHGPRGVSPDLVEGLRGRSGREPAT